MLEGVAGALNVGELRGEVGFALRQAFDIGSGRLVVVTHVREGDFGIAQSLCEVVAIGHRLRQLAIEACLALREVAGRGRQCHFVSLFRITQGGVRVCECVRCLGESKVEGVADALNVGELGGEVGFALPQSLDVCSGSPVVLTYFVESDFRITQAPCEAIAIGYGLRQHTCELCPALSEFVGRLRHCGVVALVRIAQGGVRLGDRVRCLGQLTFKGVAGALNVGKLRGEVRFALRQAFDIGSGRLLVVTYFIEGDFGVSQSLREPVALAHRLGQLAIEACLALRKVAGRG